MEMPAPVKVLDVQEEPVREPETVDMPVSKPEVVVSEPAKPVVLAPVFKVQILTSSSRLKVNDARFKGLSGIGSYQEGGLIKYTVGASENYNEISRLRKSILDKFPEAFIIAFKDGVRMDVNEAIREFKKNKGIK